MYKGPGRVLVLSLINSEIGIEIGWGLSSLPLSLQSKMKLFARTLCFGTNLVYARVEVFDLLKKPDTPSVVVRQKQKGNRGALEDLLKTEKSYD